MPAIVFFNHLPRRKKGDIFRIIESARPLICLSVLYCFPRHRLRRRFWRHSIRSRRRRRKIYSCFFFCCELSPSRIFFDIFFSPFSCFSAYSPCLVFLLSFTFFIYFNSFHLFSSSFDIIVLIHFLFFSCSSFSSSPSAPPAPPLPSPFNFLDCLSSSKFFSIFNFLTSLLPLPFPSQFLLHLSTHCILTS